MCRSFQLTGRWASPGAPCKKQSLTLVTKCTFVCFTLSLHYMTLISMGIKYVALFLVENIHKLKLLGVFSVGLLVSFKHCFEILHIVLIKTFPWDV